MKDTSEGGKTTWKRLFLYGIFPLYDEMKLVSGVSVQPNGCTGIFFVFRENVRNVVRY